MRLFVVIGKDFCKVMGSVLHMMQVHRAEIPGMEMERENRVCAMRWGVCRSTAAISFLRR